MGVNCCSYEKEPMEITVTKPEENIKEKIINQNNAQNDNNNNIHILDIEQNQNNKNIIDNNLNQPYYYSVNQSNTSPLSQKEIDDLLNQALNNEDNNNNQNILYTNNSNQDIAYTNSNNTQNQNVNFDDLYQNQNSGQNGQMISIENELDKYLSSQQNNENQIQYQNNANLEEILKQQSNQSNTELNIDEILKNSEFKSNEQINTDNNLNLDSLFNQQRDSQIDDELINKIFEYSEQRNKNNPMYQSQQIKPSQMKNILNENNDNNINKFYSPNNSPQRSGILNSVSAKI